MPVTRNISHFLPWSNPVFEGDISGATLVQGFRTLPGEQMSQVLPYYGSKQKGIIKRDDYNGTRAPPVSIGVCGHSPTIRAFLDNAGVPSWGTKAASGAYSKLREASVGDNTSLGTLAAERREAYGMIANRLVGLTRAYRSLRKGDFKQFLKELSVDPKRKHRSLARTVGREASGLWLEYWFGWKPTVNDLYSIGSVLSQDLPGSRYSGTSGRKYYQSAGTDSSWYSEEGVYICKTGATIKLVNPNLFLLQQLGVLNPLSIAWEVVPFSFVVDWFTGFGTYLNALTDWVGLDVTDPYATYLWKLKLGIFEGAGNRADFQAGKRIIAHYPKGYFMVRRKGLQRPIPTYPKLLNLGHSATRATTAASLLTQLFIKP